MTPKKVRINLASHAELLALPGLTSQQAEAIVRYRTQHGPIADAGQLATVLGASYLPDTLRGLVDFSPAASRPPKPPVRRETEDGWAQLMPVLGEAS